MPLATETQLALTMRPSDFEGIIGLESAVRSVRTKLDKGEVPRAFLIKGPYGCGKTTLAHIIAKYIQGPLFEGDPEVREVNAANYRKIEHMRELAASTGSYPMVGTYSVIILDECHKLTGDSQDVLLKELEVRSSPTVWILATTDPDKINSGVRDRCFPVVVEGMTPESRSELIKRAVEKTGFTGDTTPFLDLINKRKVSSPRKILNAFDQLTTGKTPEEAVATMTVEATPEMHDIAFAVCFGKWDAATTMFGGTTTIQPLGKLLKDLDERLKKKPAADSNVDEADGVVDDDDVADSKPDTARILRAVVAAFLKGQVLPSIKKGNIYTYKDAAKAGRAFKALYCLANTVPVDAFELQWSGLIPTLFRVNEIMQGK